MCFYEIEPSIINLLIHHRNFLQKSILLLNIPKNLLVPKPTFLSQILIFSWSINLAKPSTSHWLYHSSAFFHKSGCKVHMFSNLKGVGLHCTTWMEINKKMSEQGRGSTCCTTNENSFPTSFVIKKWSSLKDAFRRCPAVNWVFPRGRCHSSKSWMNASNSLISARPPEPPFLSTALQITLLSPQKPTLESTNLRKYQTPRKSRLLLICTGTIGWCKPPVPTTPNI